MNVSFNVIEVGGYAAAIEGMRFPTKSIGDSVRVVPATLTDASIILGKKDTTLASHLISKGSVHGKFQRGITAWFNINMPRSIWSELDTYSVGVDMISSESTMYTLKKECKEITKDMFVDYTPDVIIRCFKRTVNNLSKQYGSIKDIPKHILKSILPEGFLQARNRGFSYQTLRSIYTYRFDHELLEWQIICEAIKQLPYFEELILGI